MRETGQRISGDFGARLRALRSRYPTLTISTEIVHHTDHLIAFRATIAIDTLVHAQGHAAQPAEPTGAFVTAAEMLAVEQALLLGGFDLPDDALPLEAEANQAIPLPSLAPSAASAVTATAPRPQEREERPKTTATPLAVGEGPEQAPSSVSILPSAPEASATPEIRPAGAETIPMGADPPSPPAPRPKRDRQAERARAKARTAGAEEANRSDGEQSGLFVPAPPNPQPEDTASADTHPATAEPTVATDTASVTTPITDEVVSIHPAPPPLAVGESTPKTTPATVVSTSPATSRRTRARPAAAPPPATPTPDTPPTREALREAWQVGRPIPAWWPQSRPIVTQPIGKTRVNRLRALALDEEISTSLLDTYSTLLFGVAVAGLDQAQSLILEERLNPVYPSPLEELRIRRILHPLAVSDEMTITDDQSFFIRWSDVPPIEEAPEPAAPPTITWRERGKKGGGRRR